MKYKTLTWKVFVISVYVKYLKQFCFKTLYFRRHVCTCRLYEHVPLLHSCVGHLLGSPRTGNTVKWQIILLLDCKLYERWLFLICCSSQRTVTKMSVPNACRFSTAQCGLPLGFVCLNVRRQSASGTFCDRPIGSTFSVVFLEHRAHVELSWYQKFMLLMQPSQN